MTTDEKPADDAPQEGTTDEPSAEPFDEARALAKIKESNREAQALRKRLQDAEARLAKIDEDGKSELEKAIARAEAAEKSAADAEAKRLRLQVATDKGLPAGLAARLQGSTLEELEADAAELLESFPPATPSAAAPAGRPVEARPASADPTQGPVEMDPAKLAETVPRSSLL